MQIRPGDKPGDLYWSGTDEFGVAAQGKFTGAEFQFYSEGRGQDAVHEISIKYPDNVRHGDEIFNESKIILIGEWEWEEFKNFAKNLAP